MLKKFLAVAAASAMSSPVFAGFYFNTEVNSGFLGKDYLGSVTDLHLGYEGGNDSASYYVQGGLSVNTPDGGSAERNFSGKIGGSVLAADKVNVYGEFSVATSDVNNYGTKLGLKYSF